MAQLEAHPRLQSAIASSTILERRKLTRELGPHGAIGRVVSGILELERVRRQVIELPLAIPVTNVDVPSGSDRVKVGGLHRQCAASLQGRLTGHREQ